MLATADSLIRDFTTSGPADDNFFGKQWKSHTRYCKRMSDDIDARLTALGKLTQAQKTPEVITEMGSLSQRKKCVCVIRTLCALVNIVEGTSISFRYVGGIG